MFSSQFVWALGISSLVAAFAPNPAHAQQRTPAPPEFIAWLPVTPAEQQMKTPVVEKDAGAEILLWRIHVADDFLGQDVQRVFYHYIRLKIFDEKGKDKASTIDLTYGDHTGILDVSGRTIKADGTVLELDKKSVYKRDLVRAGGKKQKAVSFAMPGVEPGAIIEYRWRESVDNPRLMYLRLHFQREFPVQKVAYFVKPLPSEYAAGYQMRLMPFNCKITPFKLENDGYNSTTVQSVPATREEVYAPSDPNLNAWALLFYYTGNRNDIDRYWAEIGKKGYQALKGSLKVSDEMKAAATEVVKDAKDDEAKAVALIGLTRQRVRALFDSTVSDAERQKFLKDLPKDRRLTASETFKKGMGLPNDMNVVFAAMAQHVGLETRPAWVADRNEITFHPKATPDDYFLENIDIAVKLGDTWKVFDVSTKLLPPAMISWREEGMFALLGDPKSPSFIETPTAAAESSTESRVAKFALSLDGSLDGDVEESYTGHRAEDHRSQLSRKTAAQQEEWLHERIIQLFPGAEVTAMKVENVDDPTRELKARYHLEAPHYATATGKRMLFQSSPFRRSQASPFTASERRYPVHFPYAWQELDEIHFQLPEGWGLDNADSPGSMDLGKTGVYEVKMMISSRNELSATRKFTFGNGGNLFFMPENYPTLKKVFDEIQRRDGHSMSLTEKN